MIAAVRRIAIGAAVLGTVPVLLWAANRWEAVMIAMSLVLAALTVIAAIGLMYLIGETIDRGGR